MPLLKSPLVTLFITASLLLSLFLWLASVQGCTETSSVDLSNPMLSIDFNSIDDDPSDRDVPLVCSVKIGTVGSDTVLHGDMLHIGITNLASPPDSPPPKAA